MIVDTLNLNHLRIFEVVFRHRSMTAAAQELHMTQSGVSQHIKTLESMIGIALFDRVQLKLVPTAKAVALYERCAAGLTEIERGLADAQTKRGELEGKVSIGMPVEFGNNILLPKIAAFCQDHPKVTFRLRIALAPQINELLTQGDLDFAFVDDFTHDRRVTTERVFEEVLGLYIRKESLSRKPGKNPLAYFETLDYVDYQENGTVLKAWFAHHFHEKKPQLKIRASILDVQGVGRLIASGAGAGVLPGHVADRFTKQGVALHCFAGSGKPLKNAISIASLKGRTQTPACLAVISHLKKTLQSDSKA